MDIAGNPMEKFFHNPWGYWRHAITITEKLGLRGAAPVRIFDVGCGVPFFLRVCKDLGHDVAGLDIPGKVRERAAAILGIPYHAMMLTPDSEIPPRFWNYDFITLMGVNLRHSATEWWSEGERRALLLDLWGRIRPGGRLCIRPNWSPENAFLLYAHWWKQHFGVSDKHLDIETIQVSITKPE